MNFANKVKKNQGHSIMKITKATELKTIPEISELRFGKHFTDHMFFSHYSVDKGWDEGEITPYGPFQMDPAASVFHYGQALFEGIKAFLQKDGTIAVFRPEFNANRLREGAKRICLPEPPVELFINGIKELLKIDKRWMPAQKGNAMYIRPTLIGTEDFLGVRPSSKALFYTILSPVGRYYDTTSPSVKIWVEREDTRAAKGGLGAIKAGANYAASLRASHNANLKGYSQVLWTDTSSDYVEEVGTMNVFFKVGDKIITPALNGSILEGGTRGCCIQLLEDAGYNVEQRAISLKELHTYYSNGELKEIFGTGTAAVITPVDTLAFEDEEWTISEGFGPTAEWLFNEISDIQYGEKEDRFNWLVPLDKL